MMMQLRALFLAPASLRPSPTRRHGTVQQAEVGVGASHL